MQYWKEKIGGLYLEQAQNVQVTGKREVNEYWKRKVQQN